MPNHKLHEKINIAVLIIILVIIAPLSDNITTAIFTLAYLVCTFYITPDLDIDSKPYRRWKIFRIFWYPFIKTFKHRGLSHHIIFGPLILILYVSLIPFISIVLIDENIYINYYNLSVLIIGMASAIEIHIIADKII